MRFCLQLALGPAVLTVLTVSSVNAQDKSAPAAAPRVMSVVRADARTGRLVRNVVVSQAGARPATPSEVHAWIEDAAKNFEISPLLVDSVIQVESNYNPFAVSSKGAQGLMQLMPSTARRFGVENPFDPRQNIQGGVRYLKFLKDTFQDDQLALAAYNAGEKAVAKYTGVPPYPETVSYVAKVRKKYESRKAATKAEQQMNTTAKPKPSPDDEPRHIMAFIDAEGKLHIATR